MHSKVQRLLGAIFLRKPVRSFGWLTIRKNVSHRLFHSRNQRRRQAVKDWGGFTVLEAKADAWSERHVGAPDRPACFGA